MEWQPSEECTEGVKTCVQKALLRTQTVTADPEPLLSARGRRKGKEENDLGVFNIKSSFLSSHIFGQYCWQKIYSV